MPFPRYRTATVRGVGAISALPNRDHKGVGAISALPNRDHEGVGALIKLRQISPPPHYPTKHEVTLSSEAYGQATQGRAQGCLSLLLSLPPQEINRNPRRNQTQRRQRGPRPADCRIDNKIRSHGHK